jgi:hypothetical protein
MGADVRLTAGLPVLHEALDDGSDVVGQGGLQYVVEPAPTARRPRQDGQPLPALRALFDVLLDLLDLLRGQGFHVAVEFIATQGLAAYHWPFLLASGG